MATARSRERITAGLCARRRRTERMHRTSEDGATWRAHSGTSALVPCLLDPAVWGAVFGCEARMSADVVASLRLLHAAPPRQRVALGSAVDIDADRRNVRPWRGAMDRPACIDDRDGRLAVVHLGLRSPGQRHARPR